MNLNENYKQCLYLKVSEWVVTYGGRLRCKQSPKVVNSSANMCLIWPGDLRAEGWVTGSSAKASYERIMWYWDLFHRRAGWDRSVCCHKLPARTVVPLELSASRSWPLPCSPGNEKFLKMSQGGEMEITSQNKNLWGGFFVNQPKYKFRMRFNSVGGISSRYYTYQLSNPER